MNCDIVMPVWNQLRYTKECIESIINKTKYPYRLIIIDNGSDRKTRAYLDALEGKAYVHIIRNDKNLGFIKAVNQGLNLSSAPYVCIMNNDTVVTEGWLTEMVEVANLDKRIGLVNPSSNNLGQDKGHYTIDEYSRRLGVFKGRYIELGSCIGFCMLIKRELIEKIGYLDEIYGDGNFDDTDYSRRAGEAGYLCVRAKGAYVYHHIRSSFSKIKKYEDTFQRNQEIYNKRWGRTKRLLYIITQEHKRLFDWMREDIYKKMRSGHWVWLFFRKDRVFFPELPKHSNMKVIGLPGILFDWNCLIRILKKKKRFDSIYVDDYKILEKIKRYERFHKAETILMGS